MIKYNSKLKNLTKWLYNYGLKKEAGSIRTLVNDLQFSNLKSKDSLIVYHGTGLYQLPKLINGADLNKVVHRHFNGPRHAGLFVAPTPEATQSFGSVILEIEAPIENLFGTDYSGNTGGELDPHKNSDINYGIEAAKKQFPSSEKPFLSYTMNSAVEPQALLMGLMSPDMIKRVKYNDIWYTREEFLNMTESENIKANRSDHSPIRNMWYDMSYPYNDKDKIYAMLAEVIGVTPDRVKEAFGRLDGQRAMNRNLKTLEVIGFEPSSALSIHKILRPDLFEEEDEI